MGIFDEPSRKPLPQPTLEDFQRAAAKGVFSSIPVVGGVAAGLLGLLSSPVSQRRDDWLSDLERRLHDLEDGVKGFRFDDLGQNEQFISATLQATQAALRTHQAEKIEALRNAVLNVAAGNAPGDDQQLIFLNLIDSFTPTHLHVLHLFQNPEAAARERLRRQRDLSDQAVRDLSNRGLIKDTRPIAARAGESNESLVIYAWEVTSLGKRFLDFIKSPEEKNP